MTRATKTGNRALQTDCDPADTAVGDDADREMGEPEASRPNGRTTIEAAAPRSRTTDVPTGVSTS